MTNTTENVDCSLYGSLYSVQCALYGSLYSVECTVCTVWVTVHNRIERGVGMTPNYRAGSVVITPHYNTPPPCGDSLHYTSFLLYTVVVQNCRSFMIVHSNSIELLYFYDSALL